MNLSNGTITSKSQKSYKPINLNISAFRAERIAWVIASALVSGDLLGKSEGINSTLSSSSSLLSLLLSMLTL